MTDNLKSCPFCGDEGALASELNGLYDVVLCQSCGAAGAPSNNSLGAIDGWNRRAPLPDVPEEEPADPPLPEWVNTDPCRVTTKRYRLASEPAAVEAVCILEMGAQGVISDTFWQSSVESLPKGALPRPQRMRGTRKVVGKTLLNTCAIAGSAVRRT